MDKEGHDPWIEGHTPWIEGHTVHPPHGKRGTQPMDKEGHDTWIKRDMTHG
jgi:hypothetical protein